MSLSRSFYSLWARLKTARAGLPAGALCAAVPDDALQARLAIYQWIARSVGGRSVLDLFPGAGYSLEALRVAGPQRVATEGPGTFDRVLAVADRGVAASLPGQVEATLERALPHVAPSGAIVLAAGAFAEPEPDPRAQLEQIEQRVRPSFLRVRTFLQLPPPGYAPDWRDRSPARARAQEYRMRPASSLQAGSEEPAIGWAVAASIPRAALPNPLRLHLGSGRVHLDGWLNIDLLPLEGVDVALDVTTDLPFADVDAVYSEHFLEHLEPEDAVRLLARIHAVLREGGVLRLSTPNLDYVWKVLYTASAPTAEKIERALSINRAFYGWQHRFLWNRELLGDVLGTLGFEDLRWSRYGESERTHLRGLEHHPPYPDEPGLPHVLIVEATKAVAAPQAESAHALLERFRREFTRHRGWEMERSDPSSLDEA